MCIYAENNSMMIDKRSLVKIFQVVFLTPPLLFIQLSFVNPEWEFSY